MRYRLHLQIMLMAGVFFISLPSFADNAEPTVQASQKTNIDLEKKTVGAILPEPNHKTLPLKGRLIDLPIFHFDDLKPEEKTFLKTAYQNYVRELKKVIQLTIGVDIKYCVKFTL